MNQSADALVSNRLDLSLKVDGGEEDILIGADFYPSGDAAGAWITVYFEGVRDYLMVLTKGMLTPGKYEVDSGDNCPVRIFFSKNIGNGINYGYEGRGVMIIDEYVMEPPRLLFKGSLDVFLLDHRTQVVKWRAKSDNFQFSKGLGKS
jgi:hypothetical protein